MSLPPVKQPYNILLLFDIIYCLVINRTNTYKDERFETNIESRCIEGEDNIECTLKKSSVRVITLFYWPLYFILRIKE